MWCVYHAAFWIVFLTSPSFLWQQGGLHDIMKNRARKEKKEWLNFGGNNGNFISSIFQNYSFFYTNSIFIIQDLLIWEEMLMTTRKMAEPLRDFHDWVLLSLWTVSHLHFFNCILFILYVGGCSCYGTHLEVRAQLVELLLFFKDWSQAVSLADKAL